MKAILLDTNVYIDWLNTGVHDAWIVGPGLRRHMSTIVMMELEAGATTVRSRRSLGQMMRAYEQTGRLLPPSPTAWKQAGATLRSLRARGRDVRQASFVNDVLIALSARDFGATVVTRNVADFASIAKVVPFSWIPA